MGDIMDMSLDDIIKMNKRKASAARGGGRGVRTQAGFTPTRRGGSGQTNGRGGGAQTRGRGGRGSNQNSTLRGQQTRGRGGGRGRGGAGRGASQKVKQFRGRVNQKAVVSGGISPLNRRMKADKLKQKARKTLHQRNQRQNQVNSRRGLQTPQYQQQQQQTTSQRKRINRNYNTSGMRSDQMVTQIQSRQQRRKWGTLSAKADSNLVKVSFNPNIQSRKSEVSVEIAQRRKKVKKQYGQGDSQLFIPKVVIGQQRQQQQRQQQRRQQQQQNNFQNNQNRNRNQNRRRQGQIQQSQNNKVQRGGRIQTAVQVHKTSVSLSERFASATAARRGNNRRGGGGGGGGRGGRGGRRGGRGGNQNQSVRQVFL